MKKWNAKFNYILLAILTIAIMYFLLKDDFNNIVDVLLNINIWWFLVGFVLIFSYWGLRSLVLKRFTRYFKPGARFLNSFQLTMRTQFFNAVTPFATGGQPYQVYYLAKEGIKVSSSTSIILQNFIVYQIALVFLGMVAVVFNQIFHFYPKVEILQNLVTVGFIANTLVIVIMFLISFNTKFNRMIVKLGIFLLSKLKIVKDKDSKLKEWDNYINNFHDSATILLKNKKDFIYGILLNLIALIALYLVPLVMMYAIGLNVFSPLEAVVTSAYVMLLGSFVPMPGGTGGLEYGFLAFYGNFLTGSALTALMLLWRFITYYLGMILGAIALNVKRVKQ